MKKILVNDLQLQADPRISDNGDVFDNYPFDNAADWNFYERYMNGEIEKYQTNWVNPSDYEKEWQTHFKNAGNGPEKN